MMRYLQAILIAIIVLGATELSAQVASRSMKSESTVHIDGTNYYIHNVRQGETVYSLAKLYGVSEDAVKQNNPTARKGLGVGQVLKIPVTQPAQTLNPKRQARLFEQHIVRAGETSYSIARSYGLSVEVLVEDNPSVDPIQLAVGQTLLIRKKEIGETTPQEISHQWEEYRDAANSVSDNYIYHIVKPGETVYSLSQMFGVSRQTLIELNELQDGLKANGIIRIPFARSETDAQQKGLGENDSDEQPFGFAEREITDRGFDHFRTPNVAIMLPLEGENNRDFVDFYRGALLAFDTLKASGHSANVTLYNTARSTDKIRRIVSSKEFSNVDLIIGPIYEDAMTPAVQYASTYYIPIVSPLASIRNLDSYMLYQMAPAADNKYDKLRGEFAGGKNIILVSSGEGDDREFEREIVEQLGGNAYGRFKLGENGADITALIDWNRENIFVVLAGSETGVDKALASISSAYNNASARSSRRASIRVIGSHRWAHYNSNSLDKTLFFKLNVCFVSSYYVDRSNENVARFEARFFESYGGFPSRAAYRGYDAVMLFVQPFYKPGDTFEQAMSRVSDNTPLQMPYLFVEQGDDTLRHTNNQWALVCFRNDFTIEVR